MAPVVVLHTAPGVEHEQLTGPAADQVPGDHLGQAGHQRFWTDNPSRPLDAFHCVRTSAETTTPSCSEDCRVDFLTEIDDDRCPEA